MRGLRRPNRLGAAARRALAARPDASLRAHLLSIVLVALLPLLLFSFVLVVLLAREERETFRQGASARVLALLTAVDRELNSSISALEVLATSEHLSSGQLGAFQAAAERALASQPAWMQIHLALPDGQHVVNLQRPFGAPLRNVIDKRSFDRVLHSKQPAVGSLFEEPFTGRLAFPVRVPVSRAGRIDYVLTALVKPSVVGDLLDPQRIPPSWVAVVLDDDGKIVSRTVDPQRWVGEPASSSLRSALGRSSEGWFRGETLEGWEVYSPYHRSNLSNWTVALGIPAAEVEATVIEPLVYVLCTGLVLLGLAVTLAWLLSRRSARSIEWLARQAGALGRGELSERESTQPGPTSGIAEVEALRQAFANAAQVIRERSLERNRVEASLRAAEAELRETDRRKDEFLAMLGHELRNPLNVISTAVKLLPAPEPGRSSSEARSPRSMIERQVAHMARLLEDLLDVSRIAAGRARVEPELCDFVAIVRETAEDHRESFEAQGIELVLNLPDRPLWVNGDRVRLAQVVSNLLNNAEKFTDRGGSVAVCVAEASSGSTTELSVRDTGVGMEPEILDHAFDQFSQADRTLERSRGGLGLGLPLVKGLIELHGGEVSAWSEGTGRGSTMTVRLPLEPAMLAPREIPERVITGPLRHILVIEDNHMAAASLERFLAQAGHSVTVAYSGTQGIELALRLRPEVVLCDIGLPGSDGYHVARTLRAHAELRGVHLVAITGYGRAADQERARAAGFDLHLAKPIDLDDLHRVLAELDTVTTPAMGAS